jgi:hypothetical protein
MQVCKSVLLPFAVTKPVTSRELSEVVDLRDTRVQFWGSAGGWTLLMVADYFHCSLGEIRHDQTIPALIVFG